MEQTKYFNKIYFQLCIRKKIMKGYKRNRAPQKLTTPTPPPLGIERHKGAILFQPHPPWPWKMTMWTPHSSPKYKEMNRRSSSLLGPNHPGINLLHYVTFSDNPPTYLGVRCHRISKGESPCEKIYHCNHPGI